MKNQIEVASSYPETVDHDDGDRFGPYKKLHRALRGRYPVLLALAAIGVVCGAVYGWKYSHITYRSEGLIQIAYTLPVVMQKTDQNEPMQMYEEYIQSQVLTIASKEVLNQAITHPEWLAATRGEPATSVEEFASRLLVEHPPRTQAIRVSYVSADPEAAAAGVRSVIDSYLALADKQSAAGDAERVKTLNERRASLTKQIREVVGSIAANAEPLTPNQIAMHDDLMRDYLNKQDVILRNLQQVQGRGAGENNPTVQALQTEVDRLNQQINKYAADYQKAQLDSVANPASGMPVVLLPQYQGFNAKLLELRKDLEDTNRRIETLQLERASADHRTTVISHGDVPTTPFKDQRLILAAAGALAGGITPAVLVAALGLISGRLRYSDEADHDVQSYGLLGIMPLLPKRVTERNLAGVAAHCVHHLRLRLQLQGRANKRVFMITSSVAGEGKTSLTTALGLSFAGAGSRTLIIDGDTIGRSLTYRMGAAHEEGIICAVADPARANFKPIGENLCLLPVGQRRELSSCSLSPGDLDQLITECRKKFDYIIIDSGPVLASLEAAAIALSVDAVIMTISQGQQSSLVRQSFRRLQSIGAHVGGYVFNKAVPEDYGRTIDHSSSDYLSRNLDAAPAHLEVKRSGFSYGPLAQSVNYFRTELAANGEQ
jgi:Mrp family chromosome partitioning ATPase/uncharacterized protein involved in exopolysaccharide biosynthesis